MENQVLPKIPTEKSGYTEYGGRQTVGREPFASCRCPQKNCDFGAGVSLWLHCSGAMGL